MIYLGVEYGAIFHLEGPNGVKAVFNDPTDPDYVGVLDPESSGLDSPELREDTADRVESDGSIFGPFLAGKRPIILQGTILATSKTQRNERAGKLRAASNIKLADAVLWWEDAAAGKIQVQVRRSSGGLRITKGFVKEFQLSLVASDPKIVSSTLHATSAVGIKLGSKTMAPTAVTTEKYEDSGGHVGPLWVTPENAKASDNVYTTGTPGTKGSVVPTGWLIGTFPFSEIPAGARVQTLKVTMEDKIEALPSPTPLSMLWLTRIYAKALSTLRIQFNETGRTAAEMPAVAEAVHTGGPRDLMAAATEVGATRPYTRKQITEALREEGKIGIAYYYTFYFGFGGGEAKKISVDQMTAIAAYATPAIVEATNNGNVAADSIIKVTGPAVSPTVENETNGELLTYTGTIGAGEVVTFDSSAHTAVSSKYGNVYNNVVFPTNWVRINPGTNRLSLFAESGTSETETKLEVTWRDAWE